MHLPEVDTDHLQACWVSLQPKQYVAAAAAALSGMHICTGTPSAAGWCYSRETVLQSFTYTAAIVEEPGGLLSGAAKPNRRGRDATGCTACRRAAATMHGSVLVAEPVTVLLLVLPHQQHPELVLQP